MKIKNLLILLLLAVLWGPSFLFIKVAVTEIPPFTLAALRIGIAALILNFYLFLQGGNLVWTKKFWIDVLIVGVFANSIPFVLINWGQQYIDSALGAILNAITPLSTIILASIFVKQDKLTPHKLGGSMIGLLGFLILVSPNFTFELQASFLGLLSVTIGASAYGIALVYARQNLTHTTSIHVPASQLLVTSIYMIPLALFIDGPLNVVELSVDVILSVLLLASVGTAFAFVIYYRLLASAGPTFVSLVTYIMPIFGVTLGVIYLEETLYKEAVIGGVIILLGVMTVNKTIDFDDIRCKLNRLASALTNFIKTRTQTKKYIK